MADALDSGSSGSNAVWVQVPSPAPEKLNRLQVVELFSLRMGLELKTSDQRCPKFRS